MLTNSRRLAFALWLAAASASGQTLLLPRDMSGLLDSPACSATDLVTQGASVMTCATRASINVGTATALAANGANCSAGSYPLGVDASGAVESCAVVLDAVAVGDVDGALNANDLDEAAVETELEGVLDLDQLQGQIGDAQIADGAVDGGTGGEIADNSITAADLAATVTFADADLIDLSAINDSSATEGLKLPQSTTAGSGTAAGQIHYDNTAEKLYVADGTTNNQVDGQPDAIIWPSTNSRCTAGDSGAANDCAEFTYPGTAVYHGALSHTIKCNVYRVSGAGNCGFTVTDVASATVICTSGAITSSTASLQTTCGTVSSVPSAFTSMKWTMTNSDPGVTVCAGTAGCGWVTE